MTLCGELMNNLDGITSALVALQLLSLSVGAFGIIDLSQRARFIVLY